MANTVELVFFTVTNAVIKNIKAEQMPGDADNLFTMRTADYLNVCEMHI
jgi:hypothetical protein